MFSTRHAGITLLALFTVLLALVGPLSAAAQGASDCADAEVILVGDVLTRPASAEPTAALRLEAPADAMVMVELAALEIEGAEPSLLLFPGRWPEPLRTLGSGPRAHALILDAGDAACLLVSAGDPAAGLPAFRLSATSMAVAGEVGMSFAGEEPDPDRDPEPDGREGLLFGSDPVGAEDPVVDPDRDPEPDGRQGLRYGFDPWGADEAEVDPDRDPEPDGREGLRLDGSANLAGATGQL